MKKPGLLKAVERRLVRAVWRWQRRQARQLGVRGPLRGGAVCFVQHFGSRLQATPHLHVLVPEAKTAHRFVVDRYGNTSSAGWVLTLSEERARIAPGERVLVADFGAGMTWATLLLRAT